MKYSNIFRVALPMLAGALLMPSCTFEQEDFFDESAALRIEHVNDDVKNKLVAASADDQYGWVIQYFVAGDQFEGFNLFGRFYESGKVVLAGNHRYLRNGNANKFTEAASTYQMLKDEGPILAFNTWNDVLTVFVDPVNPSYAPTTISPDGVGMMGDQNLVVLSATDNEIVTRGERHAARVRFIKADCSWQDYIAKVDAKKAEYTNSELDHYYVICGTDTMYFNGLSNGFFEYCDRIDDPLQSKTLSCCFTPEGFVLKNGDTLGDQYFSEFFLTEDKSHLQSTTSPVKVIAVWDRYILKSGVLWNMDGLTADQQAKFDRLAQIIKGINPNWTLTKVGLGRSTGGESVDGLVFTLKTQATQPKTIGMSLNRSLVGYGKMNISKPEKFEYDINLGIVDDRTTENLKVLLQEFAESLYGVYDITPDSYFTPTGCTMTSESGSTIILK